MEFEILVRQSIEISDVELEGLMADANERFGYPPDRPVRPYDLIEQAFIRGLLPEPGDWNTDDIDEITVEDCRAAVRGE